MYTLSQPNRNIWLVRETRHNLSTAQTFGQINIIYAKDVSPVDLNKQLEIIENSVFPAASPHDLILTLGPTLMVSTLVAHWVKRFDAIRFLAYDTNTSNYVEKSVKI